MVTGSSVFPAPSSGSPYTSQPPAGASSVLLDGQLVNSGSYTQNVTFTGTSTYLYADSTKANRKIAFSIAGIEYIVPSGSSFQTMEG